MQEPTEAGVSKDAGFAAEIAATPFFEAEGERIRRKKDEKNLDCEAFRWQYTGAELEILHAPRTSFGGTFGG